MLNKKGKIMKNFRIIKLSDKVIILYLSISKHILLELQLEFNIWDVIKFSIEFYTKPIAHRVFSIDLCLGIINVLFSVSISCPYRDGRV